MTKKPKDRIKKRNLAAEALTRIRHQVIGDKRDKIKATEAKKEMKKHE